jgi:hypothetical protein
MHNNAMGLIYMTVFSGMEDGDGDKECGQGSPRSSRELPETLATRFKAEGATGKLSSLTTKQFALKACIEKFGSPCEIVKICSPGATGRPSLLQVLLGLVEKEADQNSDCVVVGVAGEEHGQPADIRNGSRDRFMG